MESLCNFNDIRREESLKIDLNSIKEDFIQNLFHKECEHNLLLENNLVDPSIILSLKYSSTKLQKLLSIIYRYIFIGTYNSNLYEIANCLISNTIIPHLNNTILIIKNNPEQKLFSSTLDTEFGFNFNEFKLLSEGNNIKQILKEIDESKNINMLIEINDISDYVYILHTPMNFSYELFIFPILTANRKNKLITIFKKLFTIDFNNIEEKEEIFKLEIEKFIKTKSKLDISDDLYFNNYITNRNIKRNILVNVISLDNLYSNIYIDLIEMSKPFLNSIIQNYLVINYHEGLNTAFINNLNENLRIVPDNAEHELLQSYLNLANENKISNEIKTEICKKYLNKIIQISLMNANVSIIYISSFYSLLSIINNSSCEESKQKYFEDLFLNNIENSIYESISDFKSSKLNFMIKKSDKFLINYNIFEKLLIDNLNHYNFSEINHFYSSYLRYSTIVNDLLNISDNMFDDIKIDNQKDLQSLLLEYEIIVKREYTEFLPLLENYEVKFKSEFISYCEKSIDGIEKWFNSIYFFTSSKMEDMTNKFKELFQEMKLRIDSYLNEIVEKDILLIIAIKKKLSELGYLNDFIANYLTNIQYTLTFDLTHVDNQYNNKLNELLVNLGYSTGAGIVAGLFSFGLSRAVTIISTNAISATAAGPIGTIAGATVGTVSFIGSSVYYLYKNKNKFKEKYEEFLNIYNQFRTALICKIDDLNEVNLNEIDLRLKNLLSYVEYSLRKSQKKLYI